MAQTRPLRAHTMRAGTGWQIILADLSLILFMLTAAALSSSQDKLAAQTRLSAGRQAGAAPQVSVQAEPLALYRPGPDAPPLGDWLAAQSPDRRQQLTIVAQYRPGGQAAAIAQAQVLARDAAAAGHEARIVIEPGASSTRATLAYDKPAQAGSGSSARLAQPLQ